MITVAIVIFVLGLLFITAVKPTVIYNDDGSLREFGVGYRKKTITPLWLVAIIAAILSYAASLHVNKIHGLGKVSW